MSDFRLVLLCKREKYLLQRNLAHMTRANDSTEKTYLMFLFLQKSRNRMEPSICLSAIVHYCICIVCIYWKSTQYPLNAKQTTDIVGYFIHFVN
jgi:hypothetical protein